MLTSVETSEDRNCLWDVFSLSLFGTEKCTVLLKLLTVYSLLTHKETFTTIIQHTLNTCPYAALPYPNANANNNYFSLIQVATTWKKWGGHTIYLLSLLSLLFNRPVAAYMDIPPSRKPTNLISNTWSAYLFQTIFKQGDIFSIVPTKSTTIVISRPLDFSSEMPITMWHSCQTPKQQTLTYVHQVPD